ncbi:hypothetical protein ABK040_012173 [Willaertia magna]
MSKAPKTGLALLQDRFKNLDEAQVDRETSLCFDFSGLAYCATDERFNHISDYKNKAEVALNVLKDGKSSVKDFYVANAGEDHVVLVNDKTKEVVVAHRGSDFTKIKDVFNVLSIALTGRPMLFRESEQARIAARVENQFPGYKICHTGHSAGGAAAKCMAEFQKQAKAVVVNTGSGVSNLFQTNFQKNVVGHRTVGDSVSLFSTLGNNFYTNHYDRAPGVSSSHSCRNFTSVDKLFDNTEAIYQYSQQNNFKAINKYGQQIYNSSVQTMWKGIEKLEINQESQNRQELNEFMKNHQQSTFTLPNEFSLNNMENFNAGNILSQPLNFDDIIPPEQITEEQASAFVDNYYDEKDAAIELMDFGLQFVPKEYTGIAKASMELAKFALDKEFNVFSPVPHFLPDGRVKEALQTIKKCAELSKHYTSIQYFSELNNLTSIQKASLNLSALSLVSTTLSLIPGVPPEVSSFASILTQLANLHYLFITSAPALTIMLAILQLAMPLLQSFCSCPGSKDSDGGSNRDNNDGNSNVIDDRANTKSGQINKEEAKDNDTSNNNLNSLENNNNEQGIGNNNRNDDNNEENEINSECNKNNKNNNQNDINNKENSHNAENNAEENSNNDTNNNQLKDDMRNGGKTKKKKKNEEAEVKDEQWADEHLSDKSINKQSDDEAEIESSEGLEPTEENENDEYNNSQDIEMDSSIEDDEEFSDSETEKEDNTDLLNSFQISSSLDDILSRIYKENNSSRKQIYLEDDTLDFDSKMEILAQQFMQISDTGVYTKIEDNNDSIEEHMNVVKEEEEMESIIKLAELVSSAKEKVEEVIIQEKSNREEDRNFDIEEIVPEVLNNQEENKKGLLGEAFDAIMDLYRFIYDYKDNTFDTPVLKDVDISVADDGSKLSLMEAKHINPWISNLTNTYQQTNNFKKNIELSKSKRIDDVTCYPYKSDINSITKFKYPYKLREIAKNEIIALLSDISINHQKDLLQWLKENKQSLKEITIDHKRFAFLEDSDFSEENYQTLQNPKENESSLILNPSDLQNQIRQTEEEEGLIIYKNVSKKDAYKNILDENMVSNDVKSKAVITPSKTSSSQIDWPKLITELKKDKDLKNYITTLTVGEDTRNDNNNRLKLSIPFQKAPLDIAGVYFDNKINNSLPHQLSLLSCNELEPIFWNGFLENKLLCYEHSGGYTSKLNSEMTTIELLDQHFQFPSFDKVCDSILNENGETEYYIYGTHEISSSDFIAVDSQNTNYELICSLKCDNTMRVRIGLICFDKDKNIIPSFKVFRKGNAVTYHSYDENNRILTVLEDFINWNSYDVSNREDPKVLENQNDQRCLGFYFNHYAALNLPDIVLSCDGQADWYLDPNEAAFVTATNKNILLSTSSIPHFTAFVKDKLIPNVSKIVNNIANRNSPYITCLNISNMEVKDEFTQYSFIVQKTISNNEAICFWPETCFVKVVIFSNWIDYGEERKDFYENAKLSWKKVCFRKCKQHK